MVDEKRPAPVLVRCVVCEAQVRGEVQGVYEYWDQGNEYPARVLLLSCPGCSEPMLVRHEPLGVNKADQVIWDDEGTRIYPPQDKALSVEAPWSLRQAFSEAQRCIRAKAYTAAAIMCRKTLQGVCKDRGAKSQNLMQALKELRDSGEIDDRLFEWSDALRITGNEAAHGVEVTISREDAEDALGFTEAIVDYVFAYRARFDEFKARRAKSKPSK